MILDTRPTPPEWCLEEDGLKLSHVPHYESIFALANGYMGVRASVETDLGLGDPGFYVAGVFDKTHGFVHEIVNLPCWLGIGFNVDGFPFDLRKGTLLEFSRRLDMRQGVLFTNVLWRDAAEHTTRLETVRLVHKARRHDAMILGRVTAVDYSADLQFKSTTDAWVTKYASPSGACRVDNIATAGLPGGSLLAASTRASGMRVAIAAGLEVDGAQEVKFTADEERAFLQCKSHVVEGSSVTFCKRVCVWTSRDDDDPEARAAEGLSELQAMPTGDIVASHAGAWEQTWEDADVRIEGDDVAQQELRFTIFHLASLANPEDPGVSLGAKGLHGNGYAGQVFWDTEIFLLPFYTWTQPAAARAFLEYRHRYLDDAKENAVALERPGAFYPWNSSCTGREVTWAQWQEHVGSDIAYGIDAYARATGDMDLLLGAGADIIFETARYWVGRVERTDDGTAVIRNLTGPDEIHRGIDNNAYTNHLVRWHLRLAARLAKQLDTASDEQAVWLEIADAMYEGFSETLGFHQQFDGYLDLAERAIDRGLTRMAYTGPVQHSFKPTKVAQQADTMLMYWMFRDDYDADMMRKAYPYYDERCSHTSSLSRCIFGALAARLGMADEAYRQFCLAAECDLAEGKEMESESGIHAANMGGTWIAAIMGFGGVEAATDALRIDPCLPPNWRSLAFRVQWHGVRVDVQIRDGKVTLKTDGVHVPVRCAGREIEIGPEGTEVEL